MRSIIILMFAVCALGTAHADTTAEIKGKQLTLSVDTRASANLIYQLDCMAELIRCDPALFQNLWHGELGFDAEDQKLLDEWKHVRMPLAERDRSPTPEPEIAASFPLSPSEDPTVWADVLRAGYGATDHTLIYAAEHKFLLPQEADAIQRITEHFRARFERWWPDNNQTVTTFVPALKDALAKARGFELMTAATAFYGADLGDGRLQVHLIALPKGKLTHTNAVRLGSHLVVEVIAGETPEARVDVVVHELAHHVFGSMPMERKAAFMEHMLAAGDGAIPAWNYFDEIQATVIGNLISYRNLATPDQFRRKWDRPLSFYASEPIDLGARAAHQLFDTAFAIGGPMPDSFPAAFVDAFRRGLGVKVETPAAYLNTLFSISLDPGDKDRKRRLRVALHSSSAWEYDAEDVEPFLNRARRYPAVSVVVIARPDKIGAIDAWHDVLAVTGQELSDATRGADGFIFIAKRSKNGYAFIVSARNDVAMDALIAALPSCPLTPGVCKRL